MTQKYILLNKLDERLKISFFVILAIVVFVLSGIVANSALDGVVRVVLQSVFLVNVFAYLYGMTMYGPHLYLKYAGDAGGEQIGRFVFMVFCIGLCVVCILY
ncbi:MULTISPECIES: hypothetical protein [unclassified Pseudomonas]|uniref:hypothetical protein n=1 Tax=unclassified Pseudomonas TaxID=196821 RepID=UPI001111ECE9|nr:MULTISPECIES: hypothetical protein [unclassified Pseudomonas]